MKNQPIAVFDSGLGGLSVVRHLRELLPREEIMYFGDTARVPYGTKSQPTVVNFALEDARFLLQFDPKLIVVACNTASALAMSELESELPVPVIGVVEPGARAAAMHAGSGPVAILGTEGTVSSGAYPAAIKRHRATIEVVQRACPLFVPLVEEGRSADDSIVRMVVETYLADLQAQNISVCVLGCTHYPLIRDAIAAYLGTSVRLIDSGTETAAQVRELLDSLGGLSDAAASGSLRCYVSDNPTRFRQVGSRFLSHEIEHVEFVEPERYIAQGNLQHP
ncbi:MAG: glutamate racemase [Phycisphaerae bacterium]